VTRAQPGAGTPVEKEHADLRPRSCSHQTKPRAEVIRTVIGHIVEMLPSPMEMHLACPVSPAVSSASRRAQPAFSDNSGSRPEPNDVAGRPA
jgi:hypothetical protein